MMQGRRHCRPLHGKARAMACGGNPRVLPDLRAAAAAKGRLQHRGKFRCQLGGFGSLCTSEPF